jgi:hypothetical protein
MTMRTHETSGREQALAKKEKSIIFVHCKDQANLLLHIQKGIILQFSKRRRSLEAGLGIPEHSSSKPTPDSLP